MARLRRALSEAAKEAKDAILKWKFDNGALHNIFLGGLHVKAAQ